MARRRDLLIVLAAVGAAVALPPFLRRRGRDLDLEPIPGLPGFRRLRTGSVSGGTGGNFILTGLTPADPQQAELRQQAAANPCRAAFGSRGWPGGTVPVAVFTDYNCPYCPVLSRLVLDLIASDAPIAVRWHDLPILGPRSRAAARAAVAARSQDRYLPVHEYLMHSVLRPGPHALRQLAAEFGMDPDRFLRDVASQATTDRLQRSAATAAVFGIVGTPSLLVGRTLVLGEISRETLLRLIDLELATPFPGCPD
ncbi:DsbA family protein [Rhodobacteraceae bacterium F11138]|nr:DsbA family protein [Rhodobacteraceae bacterium F11138]